MSSAAVRSLVALGLLAVIIGLPGLSGAPIRLALPVGALVIVLAASLLRRWPGHIYRMFVCVAATAMVALKIGDRAVGTAYARVFNPVTDWGLLPAAWHLARGTVGPAVTALTGLAIGATLVGLAGLLYWALGGPSRLRTTPRMVLRCLCLLGICGFLVHRIGAIPIGVEAPGWRYLGDRMALVVRTEHAVAAFDRDLADDPLAGLAPSKRFSALTGRDVVLVFVESYGRSALMDPRYADSIGARLDAIDAALDRTGRHVVSGWLRSPTVGGMSWLAHGTLLSGLWLDDQQRYDRVLDSQRISLNRLFRRAGWTTIAAMPAITMDWPEARWFGYDRIYGADDLGYAGAPFNWVTMPDQYTLSAIQRITAGIDRPVMVETALISSHAPWTPVPHLVPWADIGDGHIFDAQARAGDSPATVWADPDRVRQQYEKAVDYSLMAVGDYMARFGDGTVFIVLGDHQPAPIITGKDASRDVPIHVIADDPRVLSRLSARDWSPGMRPDPGLPVRPMSAFRNDFTRAMSGP
ncbi:sulfatase [Salinisphaera sp. Q1T1-3]|uniref:sulfatase n=1 Tax=Salinisphaera sp. Q1T1-3 TaxID=2321229 RepID=UPI000E748E66|nr:sulfatase [Salinisphaera sp. Q1T1-3]RJS92532.1 sulfatase [Salinisphaera sp. Q1T1-3]